MTEPSGEFRLSLDPFEPALYPVVETHHHLAGSDDHVLGFDDVRKSDEGEKDVERSAPLIRAPPVCGHYTFRVTSKNPRLEESLKDIGT